MLPELLFIVLVMKKPNLNPNIMIFTVKRDFMQVKISCDFLVDSSVSFHWVSLQFENRFEDTANFPETLHSFSTSCARRYKIFEPANVVIL